MEYAPNSRSDGIIGIQKAVRLLRSFFEADHGRVVFYAPAIAQTMVHIAVTGTAVAPLSGDCGGRIAEPVVHITVAGTALTDLFGHSPSSLPFLSSVIANIRRLSRGGGTKRKK